MILTTELRLKERSGCSFLDSQLEEENQIFMSAFKEMKSPKFKENWKNTSELNSYLCETFGILSRHANSVIYRVDALLESYKADKEWEIKDKTARLSALEALLDKKLEQQQKLLCNAPCQVV